MTLRERCEAILALVDEVIGATEPAELPAQALLLSRVEESRLICRPIQKDGPG